MGRKTNRISVERSRTANYLKVAKNFHDGAHVAAEFEYCNAAGVLIVHAAIAYTDALTIYFGGVKSRGEDHHDAAALLDELVADSGSKRNALNQLRKIIAHKTSVSYSGDLYTRKDIDRLKTLVDRYREWVLSVLPEGH